MEKIKDVTINYISGRQDSLGVSEALAALSRSDGKPVTVVLIDRKQPDIKISRIGNGYRFESPSRGIREYESKESLMADTIYYGLYKEWVVISLTPDDKKIINGLIKVINTYHGTHPGKAKWLQFLNRLLEA